MRSNLPTATSVYREGGRYFVESSHLVSVWCCGVSMLRMDPRLLCCAGEFVTLVVYVTNHEFYNRDRSCVLDLTRRRRPRNNLSGRQSGTNFSGSFWGHAVVLRSTVDEGLKHALTGFLRHRT